MWVNHCGCGQPQNDFVNVVFKRQLTVILKMRFDDTTDIFLKGTPGHSPSLRILLPVGKSEKWGCKDPY